MKIGDTGMILPAETPGNNRLKSSSAKSDVEFHTAPAPSTAVRALAQSIKDDFIEAGVVPPPDRYAGINISGVTDEDATFSSSASNSVRLMMIKSILSKLAGNDPAYVSESGAPAAGIDMNL